jgi:hypothetical protein
LLKKIRRQGHGQHFVELLQRMACTLPDPEGSIINRQVGSGSRVSAVIPDSYLKALSDTRTVSPGRSETGPIEAKPAGRKHRAQVGAPFVARLAKAVA